MSEKSIVIVGAGAMGSLYAALLARSGQKVWLLEKDNERIAAIRRGGLSIKEDDGFWHVPFEHITSAVEDFGSADLVMLFVKAYDTAAAMFDIMPAVAADTTVLTLQNGLGNIEQIRQHVPGVQMLAGTTAQGANLLAGGCIHHAGAGDTIIGAPEQPVRWRAEAVRDLLSAAGIMTSVTADIYSVLWEKLLVNMCINPLTAIVRIRNGQIIEHPALLQLLDQIVAEGLAIAATLRIQLPCDDPIKKVLEVCRSTAENISSMYQDIRSCRRTEIAQINGAVVGYGRRMGIPTPVNAMLTDLVLAMEHLQHTA